MKPPTGGPTTGATSPGHVMYVIEWIRLCFSVVRNTTRRPTGTIIAPPIPWMTRAAVNCHNPLLSPQRIEDNVKTTIAETNMVRAPNLRQCGCDNCAVQIFHEECSCNQDGDRRRLGGGKRQFTHNFRKHSNRERQCYFAAEFPPIQTAENESNI